MLSLIWGSVILFAWLLDVARCHGVLDLARFLLGDNSSPIVCHTAAQVYQVLLVLVETTFVSLHDQQFKLKNEYMLGYRLKENIQASTLSANFSRPNIFTVLYCVQWHSPLFQMVTSEILSLYWSRMEVFYWWISSTLCAGGHHICEI
jgi:hypothetical protein